MKERQGLLQTNLVVAFVACLGLYACGSSNPGGTIQRDGGAGAGGGGASGGPGTGGGAAGGTGGALGGSGGTTVLDAPVGTGGVAPTGGRTGAGSTTGAGGRNGTGGAAGSGGWSFDGGLAGSGGAGSGGWFSDGGFAGSGGAGSGGWHSDGGFAGGGGTSGLGTGGARLDGGPGRSGGATGAGGKIGSGGVTGAGGSSIAGGATSIDAGSAPTCGGELGFLCLNGEFCDIFDHCGMISDSGGHCVPTGSDVVCAAVYQPVCGCDGRTYGNDCARQAAAVPKFSDGRCATDRDASADTDRNAGLTWQAAAVGTTTGPEIIVMGRGWYAAATSTVWQDTVSLVLDGTPGESLSNAQLDDLFARLAAIDVSTLPHPAPGTPTCNAALTFVLCTSCTKQTLTYSSAAQLAPEMEPVWDWFDQVLGSPSAATNPRTYCSD